jgi:hypothetical protein
MQFLFLLPLFDLGTTEGFILDPCLKRVHLHLFEKCRVLALLKLVQKPVLRLFSPF